MSRSGSVLIISHLHDMCDACHLASYEGTVLSLLSKGWTYSEISEGCLVHYEGYHQD